MTSPASCAVISDPERVVASATTTPGARLAIIRLNVGKWRGVGALLGRILASGNPVFDDLRKQLSVLRWVDYVNAAGDNANGSGWYGTAVSSRINAAGHFRHNYKTSFAKFASQ